jgi:hypothetical protein
MTPDPKRRWFRFSFSLRTLFVVVTVLACWMGWAVHLARARQAFQHQVEARGGRISPQTAFKQVPYKRMPLLWLASGVGRIDFIDMSENEFSESEIQVARDLFPEAQIFVRWNAPPPLAPATY